MHQEGVDSPQAPRHQASNDRMYLSQPSQTATPSSSKSSSSPRPPSYGHPLPTPPPPILPPDFHPYHQAQDQRFDHPKHGRDRIEDEDSPAARRLHSHGKRRQRDNVPALAPRQGGGCIGVANDQLSCEPTQDSVIVQNQWFQFRWSTRNPLFNQVDDVDIYLFSGDSGSEIGHWTQPKVQGSIQVLANDTFWGANGPDIIPGRNQSFPFYFVILPTTALVHHGESSEPTFTATQTALPNSILAQSSSAESQRSVASTISTASVASVSQASIASLSSLSYASSVSSLSSFSRVSTASARPTGPNGQPLSDGGSGNPFPKWAIALLSIFGFLAVVAFLILAYIFMRRLRERRRAARRGSMGSASPMIVEPVSPTTQGHGPEAAMLGGAVASSGVNRDSSVRHPGTDGASVMSGSDAGPFSVADAAIMADAFRQALRFADAPVEEGDSPERQPDKEELINRELAEEGRDIRSVSSARDVKVEGRNSGGS